MRPCGWEGNRRSIKGRGRKRRRANEGRGERKGKGRKGGSMREEEGKWEMEGDGHRVSELIRPHTIRYEMLF